MADWLPPKRDFIIDHNTRLANAKEAAQKLRSELEAQHETLKQHDISIKGDDQSVKIAIGACDLVSITFNHNLSGAARVTNQIRNYISNIDNSLDFSNSDAAIEEFKIQIKPALQTFYDNRQMLSHLGIA